MIFSCQSTFIPNSKVHFDGVSTINEVVNFSRRDKNECILFKVDFKKAYDCVSWEYVRNIFQMRDFSYKWLKWVECCVFSSSIIVPVNGNTTLNFKAWRRLSQWDPLSPLFIPSCIIRINKFNVHCHLNKRISTIQSQCWN